MRLRKTINLQRWRRKNRVRKRVRGNAEQPRLSVFRSNKHIYCQLIDDENGVTLASASTRDKDIANAVKHGGNREAAKVVGEKLAERAKAAGVSKVRFDRGSYRYHGRVAELADAARKGGLEF